MLQGHGRSVTFVFLLPCSTSWLSIIFVDALLYEYALSHFWRAEVARAFVHLTMNVCAIAALLSCLVYPGILARAEVHVEGDAAFFDGVRIPRGQAFTVTGIVTSTDARALRSSRGQAIFRGMRVNGRAIQDDVEFHLLAADRKTGFPGMKKGDWYEVDGAWLAGNRRIITVAVTSLRGIKPAPFTFLDLADREMMLIEGIATKGGRLRFGEESAVLENVREWPAGVGGKAVEVRGTVRKAGAEWRIDAPVWHLLELADQVGREVAFDGVLWSLNGVWWFEYRASRLCLTGADGPVLSFDSNWHGLKARVSGKLLKQLRPSLQQISLKEDRDLVPTFVIRGTKVVPLENPLDEDERYRPLYPDPVRITNGVPELIAASSYRTNLIGTETTARLFYERNAAAIGRFLRAPKTLEIEELASRLATTGRGPLRLLYAAMLAACNDPRGRDALREALRDRESETFPDVLFCAGIFPFMPPKDSVVKVETIWADEVLAALLKERSEMIVPELPVSSKDSFGSKLTVAEAVTRFSSIIPILLRGKADAARTAVIEFALSGASGSDDAVKLLCEDDSPLPEEVLIKLAGSPTEEEPNRTVLKKMLRQKLASTVSVFREALGASFVDSDFRENMSPEIARALAKELETLKGEALTVARVLLACQDEDPSGTLVKLLEDPAWTGKAYVVWALQDFKDPKALAPLARTLRQVKRGVFKADSELVVGQAIINCLDAIAAIGSDAAISELISLLGVSFGREKEDYMNDAGVRRIVAAHLINLTGESFGIDEKAWRKWFNSSNHAAPKKP